MADYPAVLTDALDAAAARVLGGWCPVCGVRGAAEAWDGQPALVLPGGASVCGWCAATVPDAVEYAERTVTRVLSWATRPPGRRAAFRLWCAGFVKTGQRLRLVPGLDGGDPVRGRDGAGPARAATSGRVLPACGGTGSRSWLWQPARSCASRGAGQPFPERSP